MPDRSRRSRSSRGPAAIARGDEADEGLVDRVIDGILANPVRSGGVLVAALTTAVIVANAIFFQTARHPSPFFAGNQPGTVAALPSGGKTSAAPAAGNAPPVPRAAPSLTEDRRLVGDLQRALAAQGFYADPVDGVWGAKTKAAIMAYQQKAGMPTTGEPTHALLARLSLAPAPVAAAAGPATSAAAPPANARARLRAVQTALNQIGYGPVKIDGLESNATADAIRRFELDNGMPLTGVAGPELIKKLQSIGAMGPS